MKKFLPLLIVWIILFSGNLLAEEKKDPLKNVCCSYIMALQSDRCCLVKSSLINLMRFYYYHPERDFSQVVVELDKLAEMNESNENRFLAKLVKGYLTNEIDMDWLMQFSYEEIYHYFTVQSARQAGDIAFQS
jgi:hypothetical protein